MPWARLERALASDALVVSLSPFRAGLGEKATLLIPGPAPLEESIELDGPADAPFATLAFAPALLSPPKDLALPEEILREAAEAAGLSLPAPAAGARSAALLAAKRGRLYDPAAASFVATGDVADANALGELFARGACWVDDATPEPKGRFALLRDGEAPRLLEAALGAPSEPSGAPRVPPTGGRLGGAPVPPPHEADPRDGTLHPARRRDLHAPGRNAMHTSKHTSSLPAHRYTLVVDLDRCTGCGACGTACAVENNIPPAAEKATERTGTVWMRVHEAPAAGDGPTTFVPIPCQQCDNPPCVDVCPQRAIEYDPRTGIVAQIPVRCLGCRYCMVACPYHTRSFNWWTPEWPEGMKATLNPDVSVRTRGVVEKCNFCVQRLQAARAKASAAGQTEIDPADYVPACVEACPSRALSFGDAADEKGEVARLAKDPESFRLLAGLGTGPKVLYRSSDPAVRERLSRTGVTRG